MLEVFCAMTHYRHNMPLDFRLNIGFFSVDLKKKEFSTLRCQPDIQKL